MLTPASQAHVPPIRAPSPNAFKRSVWTSPRSPSESASSTGAGAAPALTPSRRNSRCIETDMMDDGSTGSVPTNSLSQPRRLSGDLFDRPRCPDDAAQLEQLAYMEQMYNTIQALNAELEKERQERAQLLAASSSELEDDVAAALEYPSFEAGGGRPEMKLVVDRPPSAADGSPSRRARPRAASPSHHQQQQSPSQSRPQPPKRPAAPPAQGAPTLSKDQIELCATLGKNAELRIRTKEMEKAAEKTSAQLDETQKQMKMAERRISNREEKLRILMKEKLHWQKELKDMRDQVVEEKMRQVELFRRLETVKREYAAQVEQAERDLNDMHDENQSLRAQVAEAKAHMALQGKKLEDVARQAREEKEKLVACVAETRYKFKEWKEGEAVALRNSREQAVSSVRTEYELKIVRHQEEKQKLREKVRDLEVALRLIQKDRSLSPLELSLRKATILGSKDSAATSESELIEAHSRIRELEALMKHTQEYQKRQENIIKVSEATISRLVQEREVMALENLSMQQLTGGYMSLTSSPDAGSYPPSMASYSASSPSSEQRDAPKRRAYGSVKSPSTSLDTATHAKPKARAHPASSSPLLMPQPSDDSHSEQRSSSPSPTFSLMTAALPSRLSRVAIGDESHFGLTETPRRQDAGGEDESSKVQPELVLPESIVEEVRAKAAPAPNDSLEASVDESAMPSLLPVSSNERLLATEVARLRKELEDLKTVILGQTGSESKVELDSGSPGQDDNDASPSSLPMAEEEILSLSDELSAGVVLNGIENIHSDIDDPKQTHEAASPDNTTSIGAAESVREESSDRQEEEAPASDSEHLSSDVLISSDVRELPQDNTFGDSHSADSVTGLSESTELRGEAATAEQSTGRTPIEPRSDAHDKLPSTEPASDLIDAAHKVADTKECGDGGVISEERFEGANMDDIDASAAKITGDEDDQRPASDDVIDSKSLLSAGRVTDDLVAAEVDLNVGECESKSDSGVLAGNDTTDNHKNAFAAEAKSADEPDVTGINDSSSCDDAIPSESFNAEAEVETPSVPEQLEELTCDGSATISQAEDAQSPPANVVVDATSNEVLQASASTHRRSDECTLDDEELERIGANEDSLGDNAMHAAVGVVAVSTVAGAICKGLHHSLVLHQEIRKQVSKALVVGVVNETMGSIARGEHRTLPDHAPMATDSLGNSLLSNEEGTTVSLVATSDQPAELADDESDLPSPAEVCDPAGIASDALQDDAVDQVDAGIATTAGDPDALADQVEASEQPGMATAPPADDRDRAAGEVSATEVLSDVAESSGGHEDERRTHEPPPSVETSADEVMFAVKTVAAHTVKSAVRQGLHHSLVLHHQERKYVSKTFVVGIVRNAVVATLDQYHYSVQPPAPQMYDELGNLLRPKEQDEGHDDMTEASDAELSTAHEVVSEDGVTQLVREDVAEAQDEAPAYHEGNQVAPSCAPVGAENNAHHGISAADFVAAAAAEAIRSASAAIMEQCLGAMEFECGHSGLVSEDERGCGDPNQVETVALEGRELRDLESAVEQDGEQCASAQGVPDDVASDFVFVERATGAEDPNTRNDPLTVEGLCSGVEADHECADDGEEQSNLEHESKRNGACSSGNDSRTAGEGDTTLESKAAAVVVELSERSDADAKASGQLEIAVESDAIAANSDAQAELEGDAAIVRDEAEGESSGVKWRVDDIVQTSAQLSVEALASALETYSALDRGAPVGGEVGGDHASSTARDDPVEVNDPDENGRELNGAKMPEPARDSPTLTDTEPAATEVNEAGESGEQTALHLATSPNPGADVVPTDGAGSVSDSVRDGFDSLRCALESDIRAGLLNSPVHVVESTEDDVQRMLSVVADRLDIFSRANTHQDMLGGTDTLPQQPIDDTASVHFVGVVSDAEVCSQVLDDLGANIERSSVGDLIASDPDPVSSEPVEAAAIEPNPFDTVDGDADTCEPATVEAHAPTPRELPTDDETSPSNAAPGDDVGQTGVVPESGSAVLSTQQVGDQETDVSVQKLEELSVQTEVRAALDSMLDEVERAFISTAPVKPKVTWALLPDANGDGSAPRPPRRTERRRTSRRLFDATRNASIETMRDPTLAAYDAHHEQSQPFALLDANILTIDPHARHLQYDEHDKADSEIRAKRKNLDQDNHRKSIAYRSIPAFNYAPVLVRFQWSDFVVATPISIGNPGTTSSPGDKKASCHPASPVKSMRLLVKKGVKLPCGSYVIVSAFIRPLEDGNENLRVHIYDSEWVEEFQYDFSEDHLKEYVPEWSGRDEEAKLFLTKLEFRREEGGIIIRLPDKVGRQDEKRPSVSATSTDGKEHRPSDRSLPHRGSRPNQRASAGMHSSFVPAGSLPDVTGSNMSEAQRTEHDPGDGSNSSAT